ncbi:MULTISPECIES: hypothetical protein [unclassified Streptomyces]|uniref:hypothetical protein n=1 Tax=unclassified Streptomyces TaxID=2593676 RepID=UPI002365AFF6|nr:MULTISPECIES: hypothetical protein [unclassified Streptomyces]MDF3140893.1 hypothetical protein [Streptomyces sp. T21Q-yed]WDF43503.1 hypothetical protein PBV52_45355 [Streptomyces sp. T12]
MQVDHLRKLGADFNALKTSVSTLKAQPGSEMLKQLAPKIAQAHELTGRALGRLAALDGSQYTAVPGSRATLEALSSVVESASVAALDLASAVADNPLEGTAFAGGPPLDDNTVRKARHAEAAPRLAEALGRVAHQLDLCATGCLYTASGIVGDLKSHPEHLPPLPPLTPAHYTALEKIAQGGTSVSRSLRSSRETVRAGDGSTIRSKPFTVLADSKLIRIQQGASLFLDRSVTITTAGRLALDTQKPARTPTTAPASLPAPAAAAAGRRR